MELRQVKGNTWVLDSWELIPLYKLDAHRCVLLDTGTWDQRDELEAALDAAGLDPVAILCSHAHMDHMGSNAYFQKTRGTQVIMSLGEAAQIMSPSFSRSGSSMDIIMRPARSSSRASSTVQKRSSMFFAPPFCIRSRSRPEISN